MPHAVFPSNMIIAGIPLGDWVAALLAALVIFCALHTARRFLIRRLRTKGGAEADLSAFAADLVSRTHPVVFLMVAVYGGSRFLDPRVAVEPLLRTVLVITVLLQLALWINRIVPFLIQRHLRSTGEVDPGTEMTFAFVGFLGRTALWTIILLSALANLGINVTALVAGLGIGGIAIALAVQNVLGDLFASLSIVLDRPFVVGDFIVVDTLMGTVEHVGLKTTRVRSESGEQLVFANAELLKSRLRNYGRRYERRVAFTVGVAPETPHEQLAAIPKLIRQIIEAQPNARFERAHFAALAESSMHFDVVYDVLSTDETTYMDVQRAINLDICREFNQRAIKLAQPGRGLIVREAARVVVSKPS